MTSKKKKRQHFELRRINVKLETFVFRVIYVIYVPFKENVCCSLQ